MKLYVKYMVSRRCIMVVRYNLEEIGIPYWNVQLGEIDTCRDISAGERERLAAILAQSGLELLDDSNAILIERIKTCIIELVHHAEEELKVNFSGYLSEKLGHNYTYLANLFSESEGITIEHFMITHRIERVKELIVYDELTLTEISYRMHYSSVSYLSYQFKKVTGLTPSFYKKMKNKRRKKLESL